MSKEPKSPLLGCMPELPKACVLIGGRHNYLGRYGSAEAEEKYRRIVVEYLATSRVPSLASSARAKEQGITVNELILAYWRHAEIYYQKNGRPTSELATFKTPIRILRRLYGPKPAAEFGPLKLKAVREELLKDGKGRIGTTDAEKLLKGLSRAAVNVSVNRLRRIFAWEVENELVPPDVIHGLKAVTGLSKGKTKARENPSCGVAASSGSRESSGRPARRIGVASHRRSSYATIADRKQ